jgi:sulfoacetaldehyde acetyltransferase
VPVIGFAGDGAFGIAVTELTACGRPEWPAVTMVVFRNYQWGAEKRNSTLWFDDNFVGTELDTDVDYAAIARACGLRGVRASTMEEVTRALAEAVEAQMTRGETTLIEVILNQELGEPFRRDAMKRPVRVAGIRREDMREQGSVQPGPGPRSEFRMGLLEGKVGTVPDFLEPMPEEELRMWEGG